MSTSSSNSVVQFVANGHIQQPPPAPVPPAEKPKRKSRPRGKYKPRLATHVKVAMEEAVAKATSARRWMGLVLDWVEEERATTKADIEALITTAPITAIAHGMYQDKLIRLGELDHNMARLALEVTAIEMELREALEFSRPALGVGSKEVVQ